MKYCPSVPFRPDLVFCYPEVKLDIVNITALVVIGVLIVIPIILYFMGRAK
jgi:hypothetical protein